MGYERFLDSLEDRRQGRRRPQLAPRRAAIPVAPQMGDRLTGVFYGNGPGVTVYGRTMPDQSILVEIRCQAAWQVEKLLGFVDDNLRGDQGGRP